MMKSLLTFILTVGTLLAFGGNFLWAQQQRGFYVGVDGRELVASGDFSGLPNPNHHRLTMLYAHWNATTPTSNHFHGIGAYSYQGTAESPIIVSTSTNNHIPETYTGQEPLTLKPGSGALSGKLISGENGEHYSDLTLGSIHELGSAAVGTPENFMYQSSGGRYAQTPLNGLNLAIELISITPGLYLGTEQLSAPGDRLLLGGEGDLPFEPIFWADDAAAPGTYSAEFKLVDLSGTFGDSGSMSFDFAVVPEPSTALLVLGGCLFLAGHRRRR
jgi:hypothetical protein